ncbi:uncharacterized protein BDZ99DRAFT_127452 [Mytilinidion resinicola]|uniref:Uncharacterized protein n=1 Tax=Mytilinidion resinicola TaxID=574789 RepID=A0A6A6Z5C9_9PEZI|nr:uncharacterized protein BDZ99DRAFT_127452 [Mytilinidion resinicola]KAF2816038.1 hypothetical protein BDZ99DRAFT_127452 [Mytilinidion resinicola]
MEPAVNGAPAPIATKPLGPDDFVRSRELYRYFNPAQNLVASQSSTAPDTVLTAYAQLVAWRLNAQRSLVSLIDKEIQYFVAESTKTLSLEDSTLHDDPDDAIWAGCINVPKAGRLCEHTLQTMPTSDGSPACFEVLDLSQDPRFSQLPFVAGPPHFRYYVGVPIRTKKGVSIGSLFAMDVVARGPLGVANKLFLTTIASNIMTHLETMKEKEERIRALNMNTCLAVFVDPEHQRRRRRTSSGSPPARGAHRGSTVRRPAADNVSVTSLRNPMGLDQDKRSSPKGSPRPTHSRRKPHVGESSVSPETSPQENAIPRPGLQKHRHKISQEEDGGAEHSESKYSSRTDSDTSYKQKVVEDDHLRTFRRAAQLLYDSLSLQNGGGVVFLDTMTSMQSESDDFDGWNLNEHTRSDVQFQYEDKEEAGNTPAAFNQPRRRGMSGVLGAARSSSNEVTSNSNSNSNETDDFTSISPLDLHKLIKRHPRGQLFNLDVEGFSGSSSSGDEPTAFDLHISRKSFPSETERALLLKHFPGSRQVIFLPLYDSTSSRWSTCFVYNLYDFHNLTLNPDFLYCIAFCNCVMTEIGRLATLAADQQKSDFIGSISHELRSPLHGILASMEFLHDTDTTSFQKSLVETADACARTLLDTINMVLDYSRLNAFERSAQKARRAGKRGQAPAGFGGNSNGFQPVLNIYGDVDLAAITEEVVEGVSTGQIFKDITTVEGEDIPLHQRKKSTPLRRLSETGTPEADQITKPNVETIINIGARAAGWSFVTQPGAFRRIVMNLFGNSLKYTSRGHILVELDAEDVQKGANGSPTDVTTWVTLKVSDTGKGISPEYMRNRLFTPFAQESSMNPGTGLGLSLVKGIVNMLHGEITVKSTVGIGTAVEIKLPMNHTPMNSTSTPSSAGSSLERAKDDSIPFCRAEAVDKTVALFRKSPSINSSEQSKATKLQSQTLVNYFRNWFGFVDVTEWVAGSTAHVVAVDETDLEALLKIINSATNSDPKPMIIVFCGNASRLALTRDYSDAGVIIEFLCVPVGPHKLARALRVEFEAYNRLDSSDTTCKDSTSESADSLVSAVEHVTLKTGDRDTPDIQLLVNGGIIANMASSNANMALGTPRSEKSSTVKGEEAFPFPSDAPANDLGILATDSLSDIIDRPVSAIDQQRPNLGPRRTISPTRSELAAREPEPTLPMTGAGALTSTPDVPLITPIPSSTAPRPPRLLLVDDNPVNLRLLNTFMRKRKYQNVVSAEDGEQAVTAYRTAISRSPPEPPDIIFMDISMPILDGFAATRQIREIEREVAASSGPMETPPPSLVIALTGLASGRDQSEAFLSGFDLYMTKPVSFREVGRLLDNWQGHGGAAAAKTPHGSLTGSEV